MRLVQFIDQILLAADARHERLPYSSARVELYHKALDFAVWCDRDTRMASCFLGVGMSDNTWLLLCGHAYDRQR